MRVKYCELSKDFGEEILARNGKLEDMGGEGCSVINVICLLATELGSIDQKPRYHAPPPSLPRKSPPSTTDVVEVGTPRLTQYGPSLLGASWSQVSSSS